MKDLVSKAIQTWKEANKRGDESWEFFWNLWSSRATQKELGRVVKMTTYKSWLKWFQKMNSRKTTEVTMSRFVPPTPQRRDQILRAFFSICPTKGLERYVKEELPFQRGWSNKSGGYPL